MNGPSKYRGIRMRVVDKMRLGLWFFNSIDGSRPDDFDGKIVKIVSVKRWKPTYVCAIKKDDQIIKAQIAGSNLLPLGDIVNWMPRIKDKTKWKSKKDAIPKVKL